MDARCYLLLSGSPDRRCGPIAQALAAELARRGLRTRVLRSERVRLSGGDLAAQTVEATRLLERAAAGLDRIVVACRAGIRAETAVFARRSTRVVLLAGCQYTALADALALLKFLHRCGFTGPAALLADGARSRLDGRRAAARLSAAAARFLGLEVKTIGVIGARDGVGTKVSAAAALARRFEGGTCGSAGGGGVWSRVADLIL